MKFYTSLAKSVSGTALLMSSKADETSLESAGLRQDVFSHFLIRGLKGKADSNNDKVVTVQEPFDFINDKVRDYTETAKVRLSKEHTIRGCRWR